MIIHCAGICTAAEQTPRQYPPTRYVVLGYVREELALLDSWPTVGKRWQSIRTTALVGGPSEVAGLFAEKGDGI
ncbi:hypothetical protein DC522_19090 [Microvirga sp. KLBC 81]|nr:hypothetical protein DC522_19090 [Microvirga sp. KLBC 81]